MIDWQKVPNFNKTNFPEDPDKYAAPQLLYNLQTQREIIGKPIIPSPVKGALARTSPNQESSQHYSEPEMGILSKAVDVFPVGDPLDNLFFALTSQLWGGIGVYFDTIYGGKAWIMFHLDLRELGTGHSKNCALIWFRENGEYHYPQYQDNIERMLRIISQLKKNE